MRFIRSGFLSLATLVLSLVLGPGCSFHGGEGTRDAGSATLVTIEVTPASAHFAKGTTQAMAATGIYSDSTNRDLTGSVAWSSSDPAVAAFAGTSGPAGVATGTGVGTTTVSATLGGVAGSAQLTVTAATLVSIGVTPAIPRIAKGTRQQFRATGVFTDASTQDLTASATWSSGDATVATVANLPGACGEATGTGAGATAITARFGNVDGSTTLTVTAATLVSIRVTPDAPSIARGTHQQFTATGVYTDASTQDLTAGAAWSSSDATVATVSNLMASCGEATGTGTGSATIRAACLGFSATTVLTVTPATLASIAVTPTAASIAQGTSQQFTAIGTFTDATIQDLTGSATWGTDAASVATISNAEGGHGKASGVGIGQTTVSAAFAGVHGTASLTVTAATLVSIAVTPASANIAKGTTQPYTAMGTYTDGSIQTLTGSLTWGSSDTSILTLSNDVSSRGLATGLALGNVTVTATDGTVTGSTGATVCPAIVYPAGASVSVTSADLLVAPGMTVIIDGTALDDPYTLTWNGAAELDGAFDFKAGKSTAVLTGGSKDDTFDFTAPGVVFTDADRVDGQGGINTLKIGAVGSTTVLNGVTHVQKIVISDSAAVSLTCPNLLAQGPALEVDASALTGTHTFTWDGSNDTGDGEQTIRAGSSAATITGGPHTDTISIRHGGSVVDGGLGNNIIDLGNTGSNAVHLNHPGCAMDTINGFNGYYPGNDVIYVAPTGSGVTFIYSSGTNVPSGAPALALMKVDPGTFTYNSGVNMILLADTVYATQAALLASLETGGAAEMSFDSTIPSQSAVLVLYSDGTMGHLVRIVLPNGCAASRSTTDMTCEELARISGVDPYSMTSWSTAPFHF